MTGARILHVVGASQFGGASVLIARIARAAADAGAEVAVLTSDQRYVGFLRDQGLAVVDLPVARRRINPVRDLRDVATLRSYLAAHRYDIVHTHTTKGGLVGRLAAWHAGVPVILHTVHGFPFHDASPRAAVAAACRIEALAARRCHRIVTVSHFHRRVAIEQRIAPPDRIVAIPNGIDPARVAGTADPSATVARLGVPATAPLLVSPTRLAPGKGVDHTIAAMPAIHAATGAHLLVAGDGPSARELRAQVERSPARGCIHLLGFRSNVADLLAVADVVVLPSYREGLSLSLLESMAASRPVVTTTIGSNREVSQDGRVARLVAAGDLPALTRAVIDLVRDPGERTRLGRAARQRFDEQYHEQRMLAGYLDLYADPMGFRAEPDPVAGMR